VLVLKPVCATGAEQAKQTLADRIASNKKIHKEQFLGNVRLLHSPYLLDVQFSEDGSVLFSMAETIRLWRSDTGVYLGSIVGPVRFKQFALLNHSRWLVTVDDAENYYQELSNLDSQQVLPCLRIWDVNTGECLGVRRPRIPMNAATFSIDALEIDSQSNTAYVILFSGDENESGHNHYKLVCYQGKKLIPTLELELDHQFLSMVFDANTRLLYLTNQERVSAFDPKTSQFVWEIDSDKLNILERLDALVDMKGQHVGISRVLLSNQSVAVDKGAPHRKTKRNDILLELHFGPPDDFLKTVFELRIPELQIWELVDPLTGKSVKSGVIDHDLKPAGELPGPNNDKQQIFWIKDKKDASLKAFDLLENQLLMTFPGGDADRISESRYMAEREKWYLEKDEYRTDEDKIIWSRKANRVCSIREDSEEIQLFDSSTGKRVAKAAGTVNSLSKISDGKVAASLDWNDVSVLDFKAGADVTTVFNRKGQQNSCVALSVNATNLLVGDEAGGGHVWEVQSGKKIATLSGGAAKILCLSSNPARKVIMACDTHGKLWWWKFPDNINTKPDEVPLLKSESSAKPTLPMLIELSKFQDIDFFYRINRSQCDLSIDAQRTMSFTPYDTAYAVYDEDELFFILGENCISKIDENPKDGTVPSYMAKARGCDRNRCRTNAQTPHAGSEAAVHFNPD
jgi:WD40 repeat protein